MDEHIETQTIPERVEGLEVTVEKLSQVALDTALALENCLKSVSNIMSNVKLEKDTCKYLVPVDKHFRCDNSSIGFNFPNKEDCKQCNLNSKLIGGSNERNFEESQGDN